MKKIILFLSVAALLLCTTTCSSEEKNKGIFKKNVPECVKKMIKNTNVILRADEYCSTDDTKRIYDFVSPPNYIVMWNDEKCNAFFVVEKGLPSLNPNQDNWIKGYLLPNGTIEYKDDIYHFKRIVFTKK